MYTQPTPRRDPRGFLFDGLVSAAVFRLTLAPSAAPSLSRYILFIAIAPPTDLVH